MTSNQDLIDQEMGTLPPSTVDVDAVIARQRRRVRVRQAGTVAAAVAVLAGFATVPAVLPRWAAPRHPAGPATSAAPGPSPTKSVRERETDRLTTVLKALLAADLPRAQFGPQSRVGTDPLVFLDQGPDFATAASVTDSAGTGLVYVSVGKEDTYLREHGACYSDPKPLDVQVFDCAVQSTVDGPIMTITMKSGHYTRYYAELMRTDGNSVCVDVANGTAGPPDAQRAEPPLTKEQVIALAENPDLATTVP